MVNLEDKLSEGLKDVLYDKPDDYTIAVVIEPTQNKILEYKSKLQKPPYPKEGITKEGIEKTAKKVFSEIYDFFEKNNVQYYGFAVAKTSLWAELSKVLIYDLISYSSVRYIGEPKLEPLSSHLDKEEEFHEKIAKIGADTVIGGLAGVWAGIKLLLLSRKYGKEKVEKELEKMFKPKKVKPKKSIDNYVQGELIVGFEKNVSKEFAEEFIKLLGYEVLNSSAYESRLKMMTIKVPEGREFENVNVLSNYKRIVRYVEPNSIVKGAR